jgi:hypothetical protein
MIYERASLASRFPYGAAVVSIPLPRPVPVPVSSLRRAAPSGGVEPIKSTQEGREGR